jgi:tRNA threonylcarbamoyladenosine biosynthesis protein TsaB
MALLLSLETSTHMFSCALHRDDKLAAFNESADAQTTASQLAVMVDNLFVKSSLRKKELDAIVIASGPGSYTGLRIGVATAKGMCYALSVPLISVNTLSLMSQQFIDQFSDEFELKQSLLCPMLDARRMEVYCMISNNAGEIEEPIQAKVIDEQSFASRLDRQMIYFFGEGSDKCKNSIHHHNAKFVSGIKPSAALLGRMGFQKYLDNEVENIDLFEPLYLKDFVIKKPKLIA